MRQDLIFAWRELRKQPGLALTAILSQLHGAPPKAMKDCLDQDKLKHVLPGLKMAVG